ncbi:hypothetical protein [Cellulomonas sp. PhB143]|uniref:hypothetical protein n=1 Tax=Cellulomonas sp. PhB143 TaxID=2485186 RepID=UPI0011CEB811|nr:hypothetical protein [Cellulomonas sp. PhB143]
MTSTSTSRGTGPRAERASGSRATTRFAAAGLFAIASMIPFAGTSAATTGSVHQVIAAARSQTDAISANLAAARTDARSLGGTLRAMVSSAVESAAAASEQAGTALTSASDAARSTEDLLGRATVEIADAQVALEAAWAELHHATDQVAGSGTPVPGSLTELSDHLDALRGQTEAG